jgi:hypothetical protein
MRNKVSESMGGWRGVALACIAALGLGTIVGCGGGGDDEGCVFDFSPRCPIVIGPWEWKDAFVDRQRITVQVGGTAVFSVRTSGIDKPTYQWQRASGGGPFVDILGATGATYTLAGAQLADDGAQFQVIVPGVNVYTSSRSSRLAVSSMPGVVFQDGEFLPADWLVTEAVNPAQNGPVHSEERVATGGNPGAFLLMVDTMSAWPSSSRVFHANQLATYEPASQGAIYTIDFEEDCFGSSSALLLEQGERRYIARGSGCNAFTTWSAPRLGSSLTVPDFKLRDGPGCAANESCPDFSAGAAPLRFGFVREFAQPDKLFPGHTFTHSIDNWKVTVWRR